MPDPDLDKLFYTSKELAELLQVDVMTVYRMAKRGDLPYYAIGQGRNKRFRRADVEAYLERVRVIEGGQG